MNDPSTSGIVSVIDDDPEVRRAIGNLLRASGHAVNLYESTASYSAAAGDTPSCLLLDVRLSGESGLDFQTQLAERGDMTPVVLITGHGDIPMTVRGMRAGAIDFLPKPFEDEQLLQAVASALDADRRRLAEAAGNAEIEACYAQLTAREKEVMALVVTGLMNKQVAARLELSEITVKIHRGNVMRKMAAQSLADLVRMAEQLGVRDATIRRYNI
jgi:FixJ family two-component response regulator